MYLLRGLRIAEGHCGQVLEDRHLYSAVPTIQQRHQWPGVQRPVHDLGADACKGTGVSRTHQREEGDLPGPNSGGDCAALVNLSGRPAGTQTHTTVERASQGRHPDPWHPARYAHADTQTRLSRATCCPSKNQPLVPSEGPSGQVGPHACLLVAPGISRSLYSGLRATPAFRTGQDGPSLGDQLQALSGCLDPTWVILLWGGQQVAGQALTQRGPYGGKVPEG